MPGLDEAHHGNVALDFNVISQVQPILWRPQTLQPNLPLLRRLHAWLIALDAIVDPQVNICGSVDVSLEPPGHIVEAAVEGDVAGTHLADTRDPLHALVDLVPGAVVLV